MRHTYTEIKIIEFHTLDTNTFESQWIPHRIPIQATAPHFKAERKKLFKQSNYNSNIYADSHTHWQRYTKYANMLAWTSKKFFDDFELFFRYFNENMRTPPIFSSTEKYNPKRFAKKLSEKQFWHKCYHFRGIWKKIIVHWNYFEVHFGMHTHTHLHIWSVPDEDDIKQWLNRKC